MFRKHASDLKNSAQRHGCSPEIAEDIVQETFHIAVAKAKPCIILKTGLAG